MKLNVGGIDRTLRILVGIGLVTWALLDGPVWAWIGIMPIITGAFGFCPIYPLLGFSSCPVKKTN